ncbi:MAG: DNA modification methylase [Candidatus Omnitrophica bacterium]|nr:DNA modification methylase [Candidatus Omnitrophota bacterium]
MEVLKVKVSQLRPAEYNPRVDLKPGDSEYEKLKACMTEFGCVETPVWNRRTGNLVSGHQRLKILIEQGAEEVEVSIVDLPLEKEKLLNVALNKISGSWDDSKLAILIDEISHLPDCNLGLTGFEPEEISTILDEHFQPKEESFDFDGAVESIDEPVTKPGDILTLGPHRIFCGDATVFENVKRLFEDLKASLYLSDWPYNTEYDASNRPGAKKTKWDPIKNDNLPDEQYAEWMRKVLMVTEKFLIDGCPAYIWNGHRQFWTMQQVLKEVGFHPASVLTWAKPSFSPSFCDYQFQTEFLIYGWKQGAAHPWYGSAESSLWEVKRDSPNSLIHPTQKPTELSQRAIRNSSQRGEIIFDSCLGSGSALIAAESLGRRCFGFEIEPKYCDAIVRRYIAYVGKDKVSNEIINRYSKEVTG